MASSSTTATMRSMISPEVDGVVGDGDWVAGAGALAGGDGAGVLVAVESGPACVCAMATAPAQDRASITRKKMRYLNLFSSGRVNDRRIRACRRGYPRLGNRLQ